MPEPTDDDFVELDAPLFANAMVPLDLRPIIDLAEDRPFLQFDSLADGRLLSVALREGWEREDLDLEKYWPAPDRARGTTTVLDAEGFVAAIERRRLDQPRGADQQPAPVVYFDITKSAMVAVLNDDTGPITGWRDYRVALTVQRTPEWEHWTKHQGLMAQQAFAEVLEQGELEIADPPAATMLDIAQTIQATVSARMKSANRLSDGRMQFVLEEEIDGKAGATGQLDIPGEFRILVRPFFGSDPFTVRCRFRWRRPTATTPLQLGYVLDRVADVEREAFETVVARVRSELDDVTFVAGTPAATPGAR